MLIQDYCEVAADIVDVEYDYMEIPILGIGRQTGKPKMISCSQCTMSYLQKIK